MKIGKAKLILEQFIKDMNSSGIKSITSFLEYLPEHNRIDMYLDIKSIELLNPPPPEEEFLYTMHFGFITGYIRGSQIREAIIKIYGKELKETPGHKMISYHNKTIKIC